MTKGFVKNEDLLKEDSHVEDLLDFSAEIDSFSKKLEEITKPSIIGLVGKFGSGKSTMLYQIQQKSDKETQQWIEFDAWKYPERKDMWEGFVLDFADQIGKRKKVTKKIEGKTAKSRLFTIVSDITSSFDSFITDSKILDNIKDFFVKSPATRVFDLQEILFEIIESIEKDIYVIVEDVDRSGDYGMYFLETLKQFINSKKFSRKIIIIAPVGDISYNEKIILYQKVFDYIDFFKIAKFNLTKFIESVFSEELFKKYREDKSSWEVNNHKELMTSFFEYLLKSEIKITIRTLKQLIRQSNLIYINQCNDHHKPDWRVTIAIQLSKYVNVDQNNNMSYYDQFVRSNEIGSNNIIGTILASIMGNRSTIYNQLQQDNSKELFNLNKLISIIPRDENAGVRGNPSIPWAIVSHFDNSNKYYMCDFYFKY